MGYMIKYLYKGKMPVFIICVKLPLEVMKIEFNMERILIIG